MIASPCFSGVRVARALVFCVMLGRSLFVLLFFLSLYCLPFDLRLLITLLASINLSANTDNAAPRLKSTLQKIYCHHHNLVDRYEISISQMTMDILLFAYMFLSSITAKTFTELDCTYVKYLNVRVQIRGK